MLLYHEYLAYHAVHEYETVPRWKGRKGFRRANYKFLYAFGKDRRIEHIEAELNRCCFEATITQVKFKTLYMKEITFKKSV